MPDLVGTDEDPEDRRNTQRLEKVFTSAIY